MRARLVIAAMGGVVIGLIILVFIQARLLRESREHLKAAFQSPQELPTNSGSRPIRLRLQDLPPLAIRTQIQALDWRTVESDDYATYVANLRKIGCPEETIRDILVADINKLFAARRRALPQPRIESSYWLHPDEDPAYAGASDSARDHEAAVQALDRERRQLVQALLGDGATRAQFTEYVEDALVDRDLQYLEPEKRRSLAEAQARFRLAMEELEGLDDGELRRARSKAAEQAYDQAVAATLTAEEREQLELRTSALAEGLREKLRGFGATREEFETLYRLERQFAKDRELLEEAGAAGSDPQWAEKIEAAQIQLLQDARKALGEERSADFERVQDPDFQTLFSLAREHEMPGTVAREVWDMRQTVAEHAARIRGSPLLTPDQRQAALQAIRQETQAAIVEVLGEPLLREYQQQGGEWLDDLTAADAAPGSVPPSQARPTPPLPPLPGQGPSPDEPEPILPVP